MALTPQPLFRAQDVGTPTVLGPIVPKNWRTKSNKFGDQTLANENAAKPRYDMADYDGNAYGDGVTQAKANIAVARQDGAPPDTIPSTPRTQQEKATALGIPIVSDVGRPNGHIEPGQPYGPAPVSPDDDPTLTAITPDTAVAGAATPSFVMKITGTGFTPWSTVWLGGIPAPSEIYQYVSPTEIRVQMSPGSSVPGTTTVGVIDHGVGTVDETFTWT